MIDASDRMDPARSWSSLCSSSLNHDRAQLLVLDQAAAVISTRQRGTARLTLAQGSMIYGARRGGCMPAAARALPEARAGTRLTHSKARGIFRGAAGRGRDPKRGAARKEAPMFAVIKTGGKQYRVAKDDVLTVEKLD